METILTRDPFMHRIDIVCAAGMALDASPDHEGSIVEDVVREWAGRHASSYEPTGPAGGRWEKGSGEAINFTPWSSAGGAGERRTTDY